MKKIILVFIISISIFTACSNNQIQDLNAKINIKDKTINDLEEKISTLTSELDEANNTILKHKKMNDVYAILSNMSLEFVRGKTKGDLEKINSLISDDIILSAENNKIYGQHEAYGEQIKYLLFDKDGKREYQDMVIQGFGYSENNNTYVIHIREFYNDELGMPESPPTFLNLYFREIDDKWKIVEFSFDV